MSVSSGTAKAPLLSPCIQINSRESTEVYAAGCESPGTYVVPQKHRTGIVDYGHLCLLRGKDSHDQDLQESRGCLACHLMRPENQHFHHILTPARMTIGQAHTEPTDGQQCGQLLGAKKRMERSLGTFSETFVSFFLATYPPPTQLVGTEASHAPGTKQSEAPVGPQLGLWLHLLSGADLPPPCLFTFLLAESPRFSPCN